MSENFLSMNPLYGIHKEFDKIINTMVIKYNCLAEAGETFESKRKADGYLASLNELDVYTTYRDYSADEFRAVGITGLDAISLYSIQDGYLKVPERYRDALLKNRRRSIIDNYEEQNEYYRLLNGLPPLSTKPAQYHYLTEEMAKKYGIDPTIPIHRIQDYYNSKESKRGDYLITNLEGLGIINSLQETFPDEDYLFHMGSKRISIKDARNAKNYQILYIEQTTVNDTLFDEFTKVYEQCRDYFVSVIFIREYRMFIDHYDQFIAMCIMIMTINTVLNHQFPLGIDREYYNTYTLKMLYEAYGIPYNMNIDQYTHKRIAQNLNLLIQRKATDRVIYDIADILGYNNVNIYKYYLAKERKFDIYGVPIIAYKQEYNMDTFEMETVPDYDAMYDLYFQKVELKDNNFSEAFFNRTNKVSYEKITEDDPYWWEDSDLYKQVWETEYNYVESKYFSLAISYKMTDVLFENVILLKMLIDQKDPLASITFELPKICRGLEVTFFDAIMLLFCLTSKKHHLRGEIISIPTQVLSVLDYLHNTDGGDEFLVDSFGFDFKLFSPENEKGRELIAKLSKLLEKEDEGDLDKFLFYISKLTIDPDLSNEEKVKLINDIFTNVKSLAKFIQFKLSDTDDRETYETLKEFYYAAYYSREVKDIFTINEDDPETKRTAMTYFEFLYHYNPKLYGAIFTPDFEGQYDAYIESHEDLNESNYTLDDFKHDVEMGLIDDFTYANLNTENEEITVNDDILYYYVDHIIFRLEQYIKNLKTLYMINDSASPLEELLVRFVNYFKSFTVDMVSLETIYIMDNKTENMIRFFDEIYYMNKWIETHDGIHLSYGDAITLFTASFDLSDRMKIRDKATYNKTLLLDKKNGEKLFNVNLHDILVRAYKTILIGSSHNEESLDHNMLHINDFSNIITTIKVDDKQKDEFYQDQPRLRDGIAKMWYSD